jgi:hypothetical protein
MPLTLGGECSAMRLSMEINKNYSHLLQKICYCFKVERYDHAMVPCDTRLIAHHHGKTAKIIIAASRLSLPVNIALFFMGMYV